MQVNVAGFRRNLKNLAHNYSDAQIKVREATSNDVWGPAPTLMAEIADLTYNVVAFSEIMQLIWKRLNDSGKKWRHVYKALILLDYLIKTASEKVAQQCKENIFAIQTLKEFQYIEEGQDVGLRVREKAKDLVSILMDDERLKNERTKSLKAKERFAQNTSGFGSDGSIVESPTWRSNADSSRFGSSSGGGGVGASAGAGGGGSSSAPPVALEIESVRPQTEGEEELQIQLAMAMSREEAQQEEAKRRSDDVRLQLALSQSQNDFKKSPPDQLIPSHKQESHLMDLLDISLGATSISAQPQPSDAWGMPNMTGPTVADPWTTSPIGVYGSGYRGASDESDIIHSQTKSVSSHSVSSIEGLTHNSSNISTNGNMILSSMATQPSSQQQQGDPWLTKPLDQQPAAFGGGIDPWLSKSQPLGDPWQSSNLSNANQIAKINDMSTNMSLVTPADPWAIQSQNIGIRPVPIGAQSSPNSDLDDFDIITNRSKTATNNHNNNNISLLDELDPLAISTKKQPSPRTPQSFLGENSSLVNLDNLIKPSVPENIGGLGGGGVGGGGVGIGGIGGIGSGAFANNSTSIGGISCNPFGDTTNQPKNNMFHQQVQPVPSINQLKQSPFPVTLNRDPWTPVNANSTDNANNVTWLKPEPVPSNPFLS